MFDFFRKHNKILMIVLFLLIIPSFVVVGVLDRYSNGEAKSEKVASVDGHDITRAEWDQQHRQTADGLRQQMPNIDPAMLDSDAFRYETLERMVRERLLAAAAAKERLTVSEERQMEIFSKDPSLAQFVTVNKEGERIFDRELFTRTYGMTPEQRRAAVAQEQASLQVLKGIGDSAFATSAQTALLYDAAYDRREAQVVRFSPAEFSGKVTLKDTDLETYYKDHTTQFQAPEQASIEYIVLDLDAVKKNITVSDADLKSYYEQNQARFGTKEERRASHIMVTAPKDMPAAEREKAKAKAQELLAEVEKAPADFARIAKANSQDELSAKNGGMLDMGPRGSFGSKSLEEEIFALKKGEISKVVESEFGYHVVQLNDIKPAVVQPFEQVRASIEGDVRNQLATQEFAKAAETLSDTVYQQPDSLQPAADKLKLKIQTATDVPRTPAPGGKGPLASRNFLNALYAADTLERKHNTEAIDIGANQLAVGRVVQYSAARALPFDEVKDKVRSLLTAERAAALAKTEGEAKLAAWQADAAKASLGVPMVLSRMEARQQPAAVVEAALRADASKLPAWAGVDLGAEGYAVIRVNKDVPREPPKPEMAQAEVAQFGQAIAGAESLAYYELLKDRFRARILVPKPADSQLVANR